MAKGRKTSAHYFQLDRPGLVIDAGHLAVDTSQQRHHNKFHGATPRRYRYAAQQLSV